MPLVALSGRDREFFTRVSEAVYANPFGPERAVAEARMAKVGRGVDRGEVLDRLVTLVRARLHGHNENVRLYNASDRTLLELTILFEVFYRFAPQFDTFIQTQLARQQTRPTFARDFLATLTGHGFNAEEASRYFALAFQMRRAWYFIEHSLSGQSASIQRLRQSLWNNVFTYDLRIYTRYLWRKMEDFSTFLLGETGVGKGSAAAAIGRSGFIPFDSHKNAFASGFVDAFTTINLSQFPPTLIESELFGHKKGSFTGAIDDRVGALQRCSPHGAIFLDEIGEIDQPVQIKLLHVLQARTFVRVGGHEPSRFEGRVIAATNRSLDELRRAGSFRDDFYYRLCSDVITLPTLRERLAEDPSEIDVLLASILRRMIGEDSEELRALVRGVIARDLGAHYPWPGNVRELEQCVRRVLLTRACTPDMRGKDVAEKTAAGLLAEHCQSLYARFGSYEEVARRTNLDRRTVKKYISQKSKAFKYDEPNPSAR